MVLESTVAPSEQVAPDAPEPLTARMQAWYRPPSRSCSGGWVIAVDSPLSSHGPRAVVAQSVPSALVERQYCTWSRPVTPAPAVVVKQYS